MNNARKIKPTSADEIANKADMLEEINRAAVEFNISRQAILKSFIRQALDQQARKAS